MKKLMLIVFVIFTNIHSIDAQQSTSEIVSSQGFTIESLLRGLLGMFVLILISYVLSANRKAINWRTVGFGLGAQLILAVGVLKVSFVQIFFEWVGSLFIDVLDFTM
jgi:CNT family concentrative nucleoside transporter